MNEIMVEEDIKIEDLIYEIRGKQVMLDSDLARLYKCINGTKDINKAVKRNIERFPENFMFQLTNEEYEFLRFQLGTSKIKGGRRYNPYVFTEQGVAMLSSVLHSETAINTSIRIMDAFVAMKKYISISLLEQNNINNMVLRHDDKIDYIDNELKLLQESFNKLNEKQKVNTIFFDGQIYDAYSLLLDILNEADEEIIIIDNYAGKELLDILKNINNKIIIVSSNIDTVLKDKYEKQYTNVEFINNNTFHDRFIIIDKCKLYSCGASFKDLGKKCFALNEIESKELIDNLLNKIIIKEV